MKRTKVTLDPNFIQLKLDDLLLRDIRTHDDYISMLNDWSSLDAHIEETIGLVYIAILCDFNDKENRELFGKIMEEIYPLMEKAGQKIFMLFLRSRIVSQSVQDSIKTIKELMERRVAHFNENNLELSAAIEMESQNYNEIISALRFDFDNGTAGFRDLKRKQYEGDSRQRKEIFELIQKGILSKKRELNALFDQLQQLRNEYAANLGYQSYLDYSFRYKEFSIRDCTDFQDSVRDLLIPGQKFYLERHLKKNPGHKLKPWDDNACDSPFLSIDIIHQYDNFLSGLQKCITSIDGDFGSFLSLLISRDRFDILPKEGKANASLVYPLYESRVPYLFMNINNHCSGFITLFHELGHVMHAFLLNDIGNTLLKDIPDEISELASLSFELISMEHWDLILSDKGDCIKAKRYLFRKILDLLVNTAMVERLQHHYFRKGNISLSEKEKICNEVLKEFDTGLVDWTGYEEYSGNRWLLQGHLFERPLQYLEYGFAQLGAIALWMNYRKDPETAILKFKNALKLGNLKKTRDVFKEAGIAFVLSREFFESCIKVIFQELEALDLFTKGDQ